MTALGDFFRRLLRHPAAVIGLGLFVLLLLFAFAGGPLWKYSYMSTEFDWYAAPGGDHPFGTDGLGADTLAQVIRGTRTSMIDVLWVAVEAAVIGAVVGRWAGYLRRGRGAALAVLLDVLLAGCAVALLVMSGRSVHGPLDGIEWLLLLAPLVAVLAWQVAAMAVRAFRGRTATTGDLIVTNIALAVGFTILREGGRSFTGYGVRPPETTLGLQLFFHGPDLREHPWLFVAPYTVFVLVVLAVFLLGIGVLAALRPPAEPPSGGLPEHRPAAVVG